MAKIVIINLVIFVLVFCVFNCSYCDLRDPDDNEDAHLTVPELLRKYGYPIEEHSVVTEDNYILTIHRIPHGKNSEDVSSKVVFLMHGLLCSSADWIITGKDQGLGYIMANKGYDVWMGNARGNTYSRNHTKWNPEKDSEFWQFSWHEIGTIDVPTMIDYVLNVTGQKQLYHVGHSQGTTTFYVMTSTRPEYNAKIKAHFSLAPIAFMNHMTSPLIRIVAFWSGPLELLSNLVGKDEFLPNKDFFALAGNALCGDDDVAQALCTNALFAVSGFNRKELNATILPVLLGHSPAGSSVKQIYHYCQEVKSGAFRQYDFGLGNLKKYGQLTPSNYDLDKIKVPVYLLYSKNDWLSHDIDVGRLCEGLGENCKSKILIANGSYNHVDYLYGIHAPEYVYSKVIDLMAKL